MHRVRQLLVPPQDENSPDPLEVAGLFEGDIAGVNASDFSNFERNAIKNLHKRWYRGVVPYVISASFNIYERSVIAAAFLDYHRGTCVRFIPRTTQQDYVYLLKGAGCSSQVGRSGMGQHISLGPGCVYKGIVVHELMHAVGFWHEQSRADREDYVAVLWQNIKRGAEHNFQKYSWNIVQNLGMPYDTGSIMHYGMRAFSKDGHLPTIVPRQQGVQIGQRKGFSKIDLRKVNILYECKNVDVINPRPPQPIPTKPSACSDNNRFCRYWARIGECQKNPTWMLVNCANSCNQCGRACANYNNLCNQWAALRECEKNPDYMVIFCPAACHTCTTGPAELDNCVDKNKYCAAWAKTGQCQANPNYMLHACRKSCQQC
ncbi:hatching enzyme 1.2-like [Anabrus simplex]|uniref:hatching enzyme 1.2-like n=1 Tax=Anabrus simplex TaxID=316456 RepID=UPI0035A3A674